MFYPKIVWGCTCILRLNRFFFDSAQVSRNADSHPSFFAVYNMETTEIIAFYQVYKKSNATLNGFINQLFIPNLLMG